MHSALYVGAAGARVLETLCVSTDPGAAIKPPADPSLSRTPPRFSQNRRAWEAGGQLLPGHFPCASPSGSETVEGSFSSPPTHSDEAYRLPARPTPGFFLQAMKRCRGCMELSPAT